MVAQKVINALTSHVFINVDELDLSSDFVHGAILSGIELKSHFLSNKKSHFSLAPTPFADNLTKLTLGSLPNLVPRMLQV
ncbi:hypothetical protein F0H41_00810 [Vibrio cholerae]|nr:hypothetical protein [Vibrio cholerae]EGR0805478.1 hypothetical protein [Vibrio cholerae]EGR0810077.1 hypothetical protein [Vibrio cholerae]EGR0873520.1 hypothetical protein [Vibrio cholerae]EGR1448982.1 hypothetical protein [Vibrio cholerae]